MNTVAHGLAAMPASATPSAAQPIALGELPAEGHSPEGVAVLENLNPIHAVKAKLHVCVGELELSIGELFATRVGQVFALDRTLNQPVDLLLQGRVVVRGQLVAVDGHFGVRVTELPIPLKP